MSRIILIAHRGEPETWPENSLAGFAGVLAEFGMPPNAFATALISFNVGVELGQIAVIIVAYLTVGFWFRAKSWYHQRITIPASLIISVIGLYWTWDRIVF